MAITIAAILLFMLPFRAAAQIGPGGLIIFGDRTIRESVSSTATIYNLASGANHVVANRGDGSLVCWGNDTYGQCDIPSDIVNQVVAVR